MSLNNPSKKGKQALKKTTGIKTCGECQKPSTSDDCLECDCCDGIYHYKCCNVNNLSDSLTEIIKLLGWTCSNCKQAIRKLLHGAKSSPHQDDKLLQLDADLSELKSSIGNIESKVKDLGESTDSTDRDGGWTEVTVKKVVSKELQNSLNRRKNVTVTGMPEEPDPNMDRARFISMCQDNLGLAPTVTFTKRLGNPARSSPRRLLIGLQTESEASKILQLARNLRRSSDNYVATTVFINPHLSQEESKQEFEKRKKRREQRTRNNPTTLQNPTSTSVLQGAAADRGTQDSARIAAVSQGISASQVSGTLNPNAQPFPGQSAPSQIDAPATADVNYNSSIIVIPPNSG